MAAALPAQQRAINAVNSLDSKDIFELKTQKQTHELLKYIMDVVMIFSQLKITLPISFAEKQFKKGMEAKTFIKDSWEEFGKAVLLDPQFKSNLQKFPRDEVNEETMELVEPYFN